MKRPARALFLLCVFAFLALSVTIPVQADTTRGGEYGHHKSDPRPKSKLVTAASPDAAISYDKATDHLNVTAVNASLKSVLTRIAKLSGIEILFDDQANGPVTINIKSDSLEAGLKHLLKGRNSVLRYSGNGQEKDLLVGVTVLPVGEQDTGRARRLLSMKTEAYDYARSARDKSQLSLEQTRQVDIAAERWQARLSALPPERRAALEKKVKDRLTRKAKREQRQEEIRKQNATRDAAHKAEIQASREQALQNLSPEERASVEQRGKEAREQVWLQVKDHLHDSRQ